MMDNTIILISTSSFLRRLSFFISLSPSPLIFLSHISFPPSLSLSLSPSLSLSLSLSLPLPAPSLAPPFFFFFFFFPLSFSIGTYLPRNIRSGLTVAPEGLVQGEGCEARLARASYFISAGYISSAV